MLQTHEEVLEWAEPETGGRATLSVGELSIMTHLPLAAALPPPAPPEDFDLIGQVRPERVTCSLKQWRQQFALCIICVI